METVRKIEPLWNPAINLAADLTEQEWVRAFKNIDVQLYAQELQEFRESFCNEQGRWDTEDDDFWEEMKRIREVENDFVKVVCSMRGITCLW